MARPLKKVLKVLGLVIAVVAVTLLGVRLYTMQQGPALELWHTYLPDELHARKLDKMSWREFVQHEDRLFEAVRQHVNARIESDDRVEGNRYFDGAKVNPGHFAHDWNRSYVLTPEGEPVGAAVLLHGLTDSPYVLRHIARHYQSVGYVVVAIRLPGHGTVPASLTDVGWHDWLAATRLAVREARRRVPAPRPLHMVGFSNGGALALMHSMQALDDPGLARPDRLVLISPMVGVTRFAAFAAFAGLAGLPAVFPAFAKAAWLRVVPEYNPFKYNSFPIRAARESHELTMALQKELQQRQRDGTLDQLPPIISFHSVLDFTVSTRALINELYARLPENGSELVLFDWNRATRLGPLFRRGVEWAVAGALPDQPRNYRLTIITNSSPSSRNMIERIIEPGTLEVADRPLDMSYPPDVYSLSHVALPYPPDDALYGQHPDNIEEFGISLGAMSMHGEVGAFVVDMDTLARLTSNPFYSYLLQRIDGVIPR
ncbi:alpha/beta hydrolase [Pusillimonas noertemannii]|uniref:Alpha-beta hydrolase superfamily lysophospholipase n=1 Tax=Pusillimonas noertemannii TaxID=305977 RepID=A0A2U1CK57_9BURK|nr:alpha/beta hydrolase [Pusillimonas noertemannii]NYT69701.1 alpha/beta hydrolase [Pusillimonas noertemannii]PVY61375.1 alpha-beta hydrolase superfamily lysophospholipase [Pusillimonas noertemannii]TFL09018.1 alpha/beta hydrolase [Pusillimonas noertemannii]